MKLLFTSLALGLATINAEGLRGRHVDDVWGGITTTAASSDNLWGPETTTASPSAWDDLNNNALPQLTPEQAMQAHPTTEVGATSGACADVDQWRPYCPYWKQLHCPSHSWVRQMCKKTCGLCPKEKDCAMSDIYRRAKAHIAALETKASTKDHEIVSLKTQISAKDQEIKALKIRQEVKVGEERASHDSGQSGDGMWKCRGRLPVAL